MAKVDALIRWFMPKEERFHELFDRDTANLVRATRHFAEFAQLTDLEKRRVEMVELRTCEHEGDTITRQIFDALNSSFITPFDREDIRPLATDLDDVLDFVEGVAQQLLNFELSESPEGLRQFAGILVEMATEIERMTEMIWNLANAGQIHECGLVIGQLHRRSPGRGARSGSAPRT